MYYLTIIILFYSHCDSVMKMRRAPAAGHKFQTVKRQFSNIPDVNRKYPPISKAFRKACKKKPNKTPRYFCEQVWKCIRSYLPLIDVIKSYNVKENLVADLVAGLAVTGLHFPQGLAYALLAGLPPIIGMVSTIFPVVIYMVFGAATHTSIGTNAIVSIIVGDMLTEPAIRDNIMKIMNTDQTNVSLLANTTTMKADLATESEAVIKYKIALTAGMTFYTGLIFLVMAVLRMGFLVTYLSQSFMSGFTTGVAVHIFSSQVKTAVGVKLPAISGVGKLVKLYYGVFANITTANVATVIITLICVVILLSVKILINEKLKLKVPIPIDFILLLVATIISHFAGLPEKFNVKALGTVETGIPSPELPAFSPIGILFVYGIQVGLVTFFLNISVIKIISRRNGQEIDENIETSSYAMCNIISSFFSNIPASIAPPRSALLSSMGAKTTLNALSTSAIMLILIFYCGQFFESCPQSVLASMIMVAMKDLLKQVMVLPKLWKVNKNDFTTWIIAALVCIFADIAYGLIFGVLVSLISVINQSQRGWVSVLGKTHMEDLYLDKDEYAGVHEIPNVKIIRMESSLYFATAENFRKAVQKCVETADDTSDEATHQEETKSNHSLSDVENPSEVMIKHDVNTIAEEQNENEQHVGEEEKNTNPNKVRTLIIDCIPINFIDGTGLDMLKLIIFELGCLDITVYLARCSRYMLRLFEKSDIYEFFPRENVFVDLHDAVYAAISSEPTPEHKQKIHEQEHATRQRSRSRIMSIVSRDTEMEQAYDHFMARHGSIYQL